MKLFEIEATIHRARIRKLESVIINVMNVVGSLRLPGWIVERRRGVFVDRIFRWWSFGDAGAKPKSCFQKDDVTNL
jgi:hypothetical protein